MNPMLAGVGLTAMKKVLDLFKRDKDNIAQGLKADSLIDFTQVCRVEPITLIDADCLYLDSLPDVQQSLLSIFAGYYLQALAISTSIGKINVMRHLDRLNPTRSGSGAVTSAATWLLASESYKDALPTFEKKIALEADPSYVHDRYGNNTESTQASYDLNSAKFDEQIRQNNIANDFKDYDIEFNRMKFYSDSRMSELELKQRTEEAQRNFELNKEKFGFDKAMRLAQQELAEKGLALQEASRQDRLNSSEFGFGKDTMSTLKELTNLSVGKMFSVEITDGISKGTFPVSVRLIASALPTSSMIHILTIGNKDLSGKERWHGFKSGRLDFIKDLIFCQDLIDEHRRNLIKDKEGVYSEMVRRSSNNKIAGTFTLNPSIATASNIAVISDTTADQLELHLNGKISDFKIRQKMMENTYLMILAVIDKEWERVTIYHRGLHLPTEVSVRDMRAANKGSGIDVGSVLAAYRMGNSPNI